MRSDTPNSINVLSGCASPIRVSSSHSFGITPFGIYCFKCNLPVGCYGADITKEMIRCHLKRKNHKEKDNLKPIDICSSHSFRLQQIQRCFKRFNRRIPVSFLFLFCSDSILFSMAKAVTSVSVHLSQIPHFKHLYPSL